jgi:RND family efflux transporter MFP subunit
MSTFPEERRPKGSRGIAASIVFVAVLSMGAGGAMVYRAEAKTNDVAMASSPKKVTFVRAKGTTFRASRSYVGTVHPWVDANIGPQLVSAYVDSVLVRPGAKVKRGDVLATLDCRNASTASHAIAMQAHAIEARQKALADEADRTRQLLDGGYASANEVEQALAQSTSEAAQLEAQKSTLAHSSLEVGDCVLRAPFDGEIADRFVDPGGFVRPGTAIVSLVDRSTVRFAADVPENDFRLVAPSTPVRIHVDAFDQDIDGTISRRAPHADRESRTVHFEVDLPNPDRQIPVDTTAEVTFDFGTAAGASSVPLYAATVKGRRATLFTIESGVARAQTADVLGEVGSELFLSDALAPGSQVVTEGRALLENGDAVDGKEALLAPVPAPAASGSAK